MYGGAVLSLGGQCVLKASAGAPAGVAGARNYAGAIPRRRRGPPRALGWAEARRASGPPAAGGHWVVVRRVLAPRPCSSRWG